MLRACLNSFEIMFDTLVFFELSQRTRQLYLSTNSCYMANLPRKCVRSPIAAITRSNLVVCFLTAMYQTVQSDLAIALVVIF